MDSTVIIIGAGAAGLMAALELSKQGRDVLVLEAATSVGGRASTRLPAGFRQPVEAGAEFIHGKLPLTLSLLKEAAISYERVSGTMYRFREGSFTSDGIQSEGWEEMLEKMASLEEDMEFGKFLNKHLGGAKHADLRKAAASYASGFDLADVSLVSTISLAREWMNEDEYVYRIPGGYALLMDYLATSAKSAGCHIQTSEIVTKVAWSANDVTVITQSGRAYTSRRLLTTVSLAILAGIPEVSGGISFEPFIKQLNDSAAKIGFGSVIKVILQFRSRFWEPVIPSAGFILSEEKIPTWWTQLPDKAAILTGWLGGTGALNPHYDSDSAVLEDAIQSLATIFSTGVDTLRNELEAWAVYNWTKETFARGGYSFATPATAENRRTLRLPVASTLYFAGEGLYEGDSPGTVEAALVSGREAAAAVINGLQTSAALPAEV